MNKIKDKLNKVNIKKCLNILKKSKEKSKYPDINLLNQIEKKELYLFYSIFKNDIDIYYNNLPSFIKYHIKNKIYLKTLNALEHFSYIIDNRTVEQFLNNVSKNWDFEDALYIEINDLGFNVEMNGSDKDRIHSLFNLNSKPDLKINTKEVEVQQGINCIFKQNKIDTCLKNNAFILYYYNNNKLWYLFNSQEIKEINKTDNVISYGGLKNSKKFNIQNYNFSTLSEQLNKYFLNYEVDIFVKLIYN